MSSKIPEDVKSTIKMYVVECVLKKKYNDAKAALNELLKDDPNNIEAMTLMANVYFTENNANEAIKWINRVTLIDPDYAPALYTRGAIECEKKQWEKAVKTFERTIKNYPDDSKEEIADAYQMLGVSLWEIRRRAEALEAWKTCLKYNPNQIYAKRNLKNFTNEYGMPKSISHEMDDFFAFIEIKNKEYLNLKHKEMFDDLDEANKIIKKIQEAWNTQIADNHKFDTMNTKEKIELFKRTKISWDEIE